MKVNSLLLIAKEAFEECIVSCCAYDQIIQTISLCYGRSWWKIVRAHQVCYEQLFLYMVGIVRIIKARDI